MNPPYERPPVQSRSAYLLYEADCETDPENMYCCPLEPGVPGAQTFHLSLVSDKR